MCTSLLIGVLLFEITARFFIKPSKDCYGILFNRALPPLKLKFDDKPHESHDEESGIVVNGKTLTRGDVWGILEEDEVLGYAPKINAVSSNGWWQSNNVGARARNNTSKSMLPGVKRIVIFGESFTNCSRVSQEETWCFFLNNKDSKVEFVNFGVDGYSMCQCLLRYERLKNEIDHDIVILVWVPTADAWRDINVLRKLAGWGNVPLVPRYFIENNQLKLAKSPYKSYRDLHRANVNNFSDTLKKYLRAYDRRYFKMRYESPPFFGELISYKILAKTILRFQDKKFSSETIMKTNSEAMKVSRKIFEKMNNTVKREGKQFVLVFLPTKDDILSYKDHSTFQQRYDEVISSVDTEGIMCIDLMEDLLKVPASELDAGYGGGHNGPKFNKRISDILWEKLEALELFARKEE
jgi:hypothetical protein